MIYDTDDNPLSAASLDIESGETISISIKIDCTAGKKLIADPAVNLTVTGKQIDEITAVDLESVGLPLAPYNGTRETFTIEITADTTSTVLERAFGLKIVTE